MEKKIDVLFDVFEGEYVEIYLRSTIATINMTGPMTVQGYLLDKDDEFFYLGKEGEAVSGVVRISDFMYMEVIREKTFYDSILESLPVPTNKQDEN